MRDSVGSRMSCLSGLSDLSDISGITELKAQLKAKESAAGPALMKIDEYEELQVPIPKEKERALGDEELQRNYERLE